MAQTIEYPMFSPHPKAKLYKRFTSDMPIELKDGESITVQNNRYVYVGKFKWIENTQKEDTDEQPLTGLEVSNSYVTIKTNSLKDFSTGDVIQLPKGTPFAGFWIVDDGKSTDYIYTPKQVQMYQYLPLSSVGVK